MLAEPVGTVVKSNKSFKELIWSHLF